jgi:ferredoxin
MTVKVDVSKCDACETCVEECPSEAISMVDEHAYIDPEECVECLSCVDVCPNEAIFEED